MKNNGCCILFCIGLVIAGGTIGHIENSIVLDWSKIIIGGGFGLLLMYVGLQGIKS